MTLAFHTTTTIIETWKTVSSKNCLYKVELTPLVMVVCFMPGVDCHVSTFQHFPLYTLEPLQCLCLSMALLWWKPTASTCPCHALAPQLALPRAQLLKRPYESTIELFPRILSITGTTLSPERTHPFQRRPLCLDRALP